VYSIDSIIYASQLPLSILIVGVGDADFQAMEVRITSADSFGTYIRIA
jgi:hypothetical protein